MTSGFQNIDDLLKKEGKSTKIEGTEEKFESKMQSMRDKKREEETQARAASLGVLYINLKGFPIRLDTLSLISQEQAKLMKMVCFYKSTELMQIATLNPQDSAVKELVKEMEKKYQVKVNLYFISELSFDWAFQLYEKIPVLKAVKKGVEITEEKLNEMQASIHSYKELETRLQEVNISDIVTLIIAAALKSRSSDIHIEAEEKGVIVRFRIDGVLLDAARLDQSLWKKIISRVKLISGLKINIENTPQDGRFTIFLTDDKVDVRVSVLPTSFGDSVVMRLLRAQASSLVFEDLGVIGKAQKILSEEITRPNGMIITTGPTGSGKTTTLYSILQKLNTQQSKIITLEDPIEYQLTGINQSQIDHSKGYGFAEGLRSILRQDPDIVMVGEIRDLETAEVSINAALTGHLVLSTLHTNSAAAAIPRFLSMGVKPFLLSPALNAIIAQRLVRRICENCKEEMTLDEEIQKKVINILSLIPKEAELNFDINNLKFYKGGGCEECQGIGYKGRIGIYEIFTITEDIEDAINDANTAEHVLEELARKNGMFKMVEDGIVKATMGITTVEEVFRVSE